MSVSPTKGFVGRVLAEAQQRLDVDTVVDVHTHPFSDAAWFSGMDDADEKRFSAFLEERVGGLRYGSVVFSRKAYSARLWRMEDSEPVHNRAIIKTQTALEAVAEGSESFDEAGRDAVDPDELQSRTALALGVDTMRRMANGQCIVLAGIGGLGSVMAEHLVHQGFTHLGLIDPDRLELSNLNRFVGAGYADAVAGRAKVEVTAEHLERINPEVRVDCLPTGVDTPEAVSMMARSDWIIVSTDNHSSRYAV